MNQWKRDLDGIVGDVSEQKKRLADGVAKKLQPKKKKRKPLFVGVVALLAVAISLFLLSEQMQVKEQQENYHAGFGADKGLTGFHDSGYASKYNNHFIVWGEDGLHIFGHYNPGVYGKPNDLDKIMELEGAKEGESFMKVYEDAEITKEENQYIVKLTDELSLTFEIIGPRTIKDTTGAEYTTQVYTEE